MSEINYSEMSTPALRQYVVKHRSDRTALQTYLARRQEQSLPVITSLQDPDFETKIQAAARKQMGS